MEEDYVTDSGQRNQKIIRDVKKRDRDRVPGSTPCRSSNILRPA